jgi:heat shock protein HslJ
VPTADLVGQLWLLDTLIQGEAATNVDGSPATLLLTEDGTLQGSTGCRSFSGEYIIVGNSVEFTNWGLEDECAQQLAEQDNSIVSVLGDGFAVEIDGDRLTLTSAGDEGLSYTAIDEIPRDGDVEPDLVSVSELLDLRAEGVVNVSGHLVDNGGGWFICESMRFDGLPLCSSRWVVVTNIGNDILDPLGPTTESDEFRSITYTEDPVTLTGELAKDGRFTLTGSPSGVDMTDDDLALLEAFADLGPTNLDTDTLRVAEGGTQLGLGANVLATRSADELTDPNTWQLDLEAFRGYVGPFSALELLGNADQITTLVGPHDHCASPPAPIADELQGLRHLSIQPTGIDSCLQWWTVDIFVDDAGVVAGITLDLWEP